MFCHWIFIDAFNMANAYNNAATAMHKAKINLESSVRGSFYVHLRSERMHSYTKNNCAMSFSHFIFDAYR